MRRSADSSRAVAALPAKARCCKAFRAVMRLASLAPKQPSPEHDGQPMTTRRYKRLLDHWIAEIGLKPALFGTHSLRRTKVPIIYRDRKSVVTGKSGARRVDRGGTS